MKYRFFGKSNISVSEIGFGAWAIGGSWGAQADADSFAALHRALDLGVNFLDTAAGYGDGRSERLISRVLRERAAAGKQGKVFVATKTPPTAGHWPPSPYDLAVERYPETYLRENLEERCRNLGVEKIDLLQLHTWTRAWNRAPRPLEVLQQLKAEGRLGLVGISTPEHDQNCVIDLMRRGLVDSVQVIYNLFEQEPAAELLEVALEHRIGLIVRVPFDEGALTGKFAPDTVFSSDDFRSRYFAGDRLARTVARVEEIKRDIAGSGLTLPQVALRFILSHPAVHTVIPGIRTVAQAEANCAVPDLPYLPAALLTKLQRHNWRRAFWYDGK